MAWPVCFTAALEANGPRVALRLPGVTAEGVRGRSSLSEVIPAAGEAGEPGPIGTLGRCEAGGIATSSAVTPAQAGVQYPLGQMVAQS